MEVRFRPVTMTLQDRNGQRREAVLHAVHTCETDTVPAGEEPIEWLLLTTYPVASFDDAVAVVLGYRCRWRIEEFHKCWKSAHCKVEDNQLRDVDSITKWARVSAAVAIRIERLKYLARNKPQLPATVELSQSEIDALIVLKKPRSYSRGDVPPIGLAVRWLADLGGYTGKSSGGPPGAIVIGRGLKRIDSAVQVLEILG